MATYEEEQIDRDTGFINMACGLHTAVARYFEEWVQKEIRGLIPRIATLFAMTGDSELKGELTRTKELIDRINEQDMREAFPRLYARINDVERGNAGENPLECHRELYAAFGEVQNLAGQLLTIRAQADSLWLQAKPD